MPRKQKSGIVVSDKMLKSIVVEVTRVKQHSLYKKYIRVRKKFMVHDELQEARIGDFVRIEESRPISKRKSWVLKEIVRRAPGQGIKLADTPSVLEAPTAVEAVVAPMTEPEAAPATEPTSEPGGDA